MSNNKHKRVYSKPTVEEPKEELIVEQTEEITEAKPIDPEVFETKLFVEEEISVEGPSLGEPEEEIKIESHVEGEKLAEVLEKNHNIDAVAEIEKIMHAEMGGKSYGIDAQAVIEEELTKQSPAPEPEKEVELVKGDELKEKLEELKTRIEEFQTIQVVPASPESESMYILTPEQEEEGAKAVAEMVNNSILEDLKALASKPKLKGEYFLTEKQAHDEVKALSPEPLKNKELDTLSQHDLRHFHRTGQMPK